MEHVVYDLQSEKDHGLYIGVTKDLSSRLRRHNYGLVQSTKARRPFHIIGSKHFLTFEEARTAELMLKAFKDPVRVRTWIT